MSSPIYGSCVWKQIHGVGFRWIFEVGITEQKIFGVTQHVELGTRSLYLEKIETQLLQDLSPASNHPVLTIRLGMVFNRYAESQE
jgi:hypothetical protein